MWPTKGARRNGLVALLWYGPTATSVGARCGRPITARSQRGSFRHRWPADTPTDLRLADLVHAAYSCRVDERATPPDRDHQALLAQQRDPLARGATSDAELL